MNKVSERLKHLRIDNDKSREELASYLGITVRSYARYETGERLPDVDSLIKLAIFYQVTLDYLMGRDDIEMPVFDRSEVVSYKDLVDKGLNKKLAHSLIKEVWDSLSFEARAFNPEGKIKYVLKSDIVELLEYIKGQIDDEVYS